MCSLDVVPSLASFDVVYAKSGPKLRPTWTELSRTCGSLPMLKPRATPGSPANNALACELAPKFFVDHAWLLGLVVAFPQRLAHTGRRRVLHNLRR